ncbi:pectate lyase [Herbaspirillum lusitanum]|uniref:Pectate lyase n=1 Tax=Herbaspirillum lusitanum TaxID=213312 RepID=A0ABW9A6V7_9BURK
MQHIKQVIKDKLGASVAPVQSIEQHLKAAADWLLLAQRSTADDGVAHSYDIRARKWNASYPETTGYIIPTLYDYAKNYDAPEYAAAALRMTQWESEIQMADGGVRAGTMDAEIVAPTIFNTGQALFGWASAYQNTGNEDFRVSLIRATDWLLAAQDEDGAWRRFPSPFTTSKVNSYNTRSSFGMVRAFQAVGDERYLLAAVKNVEWTLSRAQENGWLPDNCLAQNPDLTALTHTIAYSIRGILEVGVAANRPDFIARALHMARMVALQQRADGALPAYYTPQWTTRVSWSCITGNSQMAINWLRLAQLSGDAGLIEYARRANRFNMSIQDLRTDNLNVRGALKGSHPVNGSYMKYRYPNWATKFFMDGLMLEQLFDKVDNIG